MNIDSLEAVRLGGLTQRIRIRGTNAANPVLLLMQQGPGLPIINEVRGYERRLGLERDFTVVYWDQRGTGLSSLPLRRNGRRFEVSQALMVDDTVALLQLLHDRFGAETIIAGFSFGATFAAQAAVRRPDLVAALVATAMDVDIPFADRYTYDFLLTTARQRGNRRAIRQLERMGPHPDTKHFATRARWTANFGGVTANITFNGLLRRLLAGLLRSPDYSIADIARTVAGITASQAALLPELATTDLVRTMPRLEVPIVLAQGRLDRVAPGEAVQRFHDKLAAPSKELVWFEESAHTPQYDEPAKFRELLLSVRAGVLANS
jgi:pimeloyl-ACP methyl ester carboxylesterase